MRSAYEITLLRRVLPYLNHNRIATQVRDALRESRRAGERESRRIGLILDTIAYPSPQLFMFRLFIRYYR